jgi:ATP-dependent Lon protease
VERLADVPKILRSNLGDPGRFADLVATLAHFSPEDKDGVLQRLDVRERLEFVLRRLELEWERMRARVEGEDAGHEARPTGDRAGTDIRKRIATLQAELGELDPAEKETLEILRRIERTQLPSRVSAIARAEAERIRTAPMVGPEAAEIRAYIELLLELPWTLTSDGGYFDLARVQHELDARHVGLDEVKRRILEFYPSRGCGRTCSGPIPCIVGPPDVGKRSLAEAVALGLGRPLVRLDLGGRGESHLLGTRRIRTGAQPGKIITGYRDAGVRDPVFLLEELDLVGLGNVDGDPIEALEELLDPERTSGVRRSVSRHPLRSVGHDLHRDGERFLQDPSESPRVPDRDPHRRVHARGKGEDRPDPASPGWFRSMGCAPTTSRSRTTRSCSLPVATRGIPDSAT